MKYEELEIGGIVEYEDLWHSGIISWQKGVVKKSVVTGRLVFVPDNKHFSNKIIHPHRMAYLRKRT